MLWYNRATAGSSAPFPLPMLNAVWRFRSPAHGGQEAEGGDRRGAGDDALMGGQWTSSWVGTSGGV